MIRTLRSSTLIVLLTGIGVADGQLVANMTDADIEEAIRLGIDEKAAAKFLQSYVAQTRTGLGAGPLIGYFSTPFSRVVRAAAAARKQGRPFTRADVTPDLLAPQLEVLALSHPAAYSPTTAAVVDVTITSSNSNSPNEAIQPASTTPATSQHYALYGVSRENGATVAVFPLTAVAPGHRIRVSYSDVIGSSAMTNCKECSVPLGVARLR